MPVRYGNRQRTMFARLPNFTMTGATTEEDLLPAPLVSRFELRERLEFYATDELTEIVHRAAKQRDLGKDSRPPVPRAAAAAHNRAIGTGIRVPKSVRHDRFAWRDGATSHMRVQCHGDYHPLGRSGQTLSP